MHGAPLTSWRPFTFPSGRRISAHFESGVRGEGNFYVPSMSVDIDDDGYSITARIPGADRDELCVSLHGDVLRVTGERRRHEQTRHNGTQEDTRYLSRFTREVCLPREVDADHVEAHFENGVLTIWLPILQVQRGEEDAPTPIEIQ